MSGIKILPRKELSPYKPSDLWTQRENEVFLKYCPSKRDKAYHSMVIDTSCRPHELLGLKIKDIKFKLSSRGIQYAEVLVSGKTKTRTGYDIGLSPRVSMGFKSLPRNLSKQNWRRKKCWCFSRLRYYGIILLSGLSLKNRFI